MTKYIDVTDEALIASQKKLSKFAGKEDTQLNENLALEENTKEELEAEKDTETEEEFIANTVKEYSDMIKKEILGVVTRVKQSDALEKNTESIDELKETEIVTIEIEKQFVINTGNYSSITQRYSLKREGRTKNITNFLQQTDDIISKKVNEQFNKIKASL
jgi:hypothetical protein